MDSTNKYNKKYTVKKRINSDVGHLSNAQTNQYVKKLIGDKTKIFCFGHLSENNNDPEFAPQAEQRITRIGRILRRNRLDEVPQFWNVLKGEMSIVGPRPEQSQFVDRFSKTIPFYDLRHTVRPGITGWAQVMTGYASNEDQTRTKLEYDFFYIKHLNIWVDMLVLIRTFKTVLLGRGSQ